MNITLQIADSTYQRLIAGNTRLRGSIGLISPTEGNFNEHAKYSPQPGNKYIKLRHGSASVGTTQVRMSLRIKLDETNIVPAQAIEEESRLASNFVDNVFGGGWE
ncbi:MAG TPA: hypothetical protein H9814_07590 [Candidatus Bacteroides merdigallinarum]|uniref:Uncharacterized protein n=1 Tax=Candidatus Bacteroides merdigallinarum TaxID=2838473 RepID=A0A9D2J1P6_9BACE|nr:hypothetical protein [Candidatus Bacteroides merdigallinarum]